MNFRKNFATGTYGPDALQRYRMRMSAALTLSLLLHAFLLSLQFGIRGLGLPGLHMPWEERRAQTSSITVHIADAHRKDSPGMADAPEQAPAQVSSPVPDMPVPPPPKALAEAPPAASPPPSSGMSIVQRTEAPAVASRSEERKVVPAKPRHRVKPLVKPLARRVSRPVPHTKPRPPIVTKKPIQQDAFVLPPQPEGEATKQQPVVDEKLAEAPLAAISPVEESPAQPQQPQDTAEAARMLRLEEERHAMELEAQRQAEEAARQTAQRQAEEEQARQAAQLQAERLAEEEQARRAVQLQAERLAKENAQRQAAELEARRQAEEAARLAAQRHAEEEQARQAAQWQAKKLEEENARRQAMEEEVRRRAMQQLAEENAQRAQLAEAQRQQAARAQRLAEEQEAQRRAEEAARQQNTALAEQQHRGMAGGQDQSSGASAGQGSKSSAAQHAEPLQASTQRPARAATIEEKSSVASQTKDGPIELSDEQLASMQTEQVRKVEVNRLEPQATHEATAQDARRRTIFGSAEDDIVLKMYIADWLQAVERNGKLDDKTPSKDKPYGDSLVTVALRSDGRVEGITIHRSNGRAELNEAVRRIIQAEARYKTFPPDLIRRYDVIEIRRVWRFRDVLRILEESR